MKISPLGAFVATMGGIIAIVIWVVAYFVLPNADTHRDLAANPPLTSSATGQSGTVSTAAGGNGIGSGATTAPFYALDKSPKTLDLTLQTSDMTVNSGLNFDGYYGGNLTITVPKGWTVKVQYTNHESIPHSIGFTTWADRNSTSGSFTPAFAGSIGPKFNTGIMAGDAPIVFSFKATKAGQYAFACGIPGHALDNMWNEFDVSSTATAPTIQTPQGKVSVK